MVVCIIVVEMAEIHLAEVKVALWVAELVNILDNILEIHTQ